MALLPPRRFNILWRRGCSHVAQCHISHQHETDQTSRQHETARCLIYTCGLVSERVTERPRLHCSSSSSGRRQPAAEDDSSRGSSNQSNWMLPASLAVYSKIQHTTINRLEDRWAMHVLHDNKVDESIWQQIDLRTNRIECAAQVYLEYVHAEWMKRTNVIIHNYN